MSVTLSECAAVDSARQHVYRVFSILLSDPQSRRWQYLYNQDFEGAAVAAAELLRDEVAAGAPVTAPGELPPDDFDLRVLLSFLKPQAAMLDEYQEIFGLMVSKKCPPYETEYCPQTFSVYRSQQLADIAGFYRAFGLEPSRNLPERHDHIALEMEFMGFLIAKEQRAAGSPENTAACRAAQTRFVDDHLAWWTPAFALALRRRADRILGATELGVPPRSFYGAVAHALASFICIERALLGIAPPTELMIPQATADTEPGCEECCAVSIGGSK